MGIIGKDMWVGEFSSKLKRSGCSVEVVGVVEGVFVTGGLVFGAKVEVTKDKKENGAGVVVYLTGAGGGAAFVGLEVFIWTEICFKGLGFCLIKEF